jgi:hypothetical protein
LTSLPLLCQFLDNVRPIPTENALDFRSFITNDLKILSPGDSISDKQVLILTRKSDPEATRVSIKLLAKGIDNVRINVEDMPKQMVVRYRMKNICDPRVEFMIEDRDLDTSIFSVVWLRDFDSTLMGLDFSDKDNKFARRFCYEQWKDSYQILIDSLASEWINKPQASLMATDRLMQLKIARRVGLMVPLEISVMQMVL